MPFFFVGSAASQAVQTLEDRLGAVLIDRSQRPLSLTPAGQIYYDGCRRMLETFREVEERVFSVSDRVTGRLRVAAIYSVGLLEMFELVSGYRESYPDVSLTLDYLHPEEVSQRVLSGGADLGIVSFPRGGGDFTVIPWLEQPMSRPSANSSAAACAAIHAKIPVVIGHPKSAPCCRATAARSSLMVVNFPFGTFFINASTSRGRRIAHNPSPQRCDIFPFRVSNTLGKSLSSNNFSRQDFFTYAMWG